jgi:hypothetical protein
MAGAAAPLGRWAQLKDWASQRRRCVFPAFAIAVVCLRLALMEEQTAWDVQRPSSAIQATTVEPAAQHRPPQAFVPMSIPATPAKSKAPAATAKPAAVSGKVETLGEPPEEALAIRHPWLAGRLDEDRAKTGVTVVGAYLRPTGVLTVLVVSEDKGLAALEEAVVILPSGQRVRAKSATEIRHAINKSVLLAFPLSAGEESSLGEDARVTLMSEHADAPDLKIEGIEVTRGGKGKGRGGEGGGVVHCLAPLFEGVNVGMMVEWIEYHRALGVEHFHVYDGVHDGDMLAVLLAYATEGLVSYHDWKDIGCAGDKPEMCAPSAKVRYEYHAQDLAIHDCYLRNEGDYRWAIFGDLDEMWVIEDGGAARTTTAVLPPLEALKQAHPEKDAWILKKVWVLTNDEQPTDESKGPLMIGRYTRKHVAAQRGIAGNGRVKYTIRLNYGESYVTLPLLIHEPGTNNSAIGVVKPRRDRDEGTSANKAGVVLHFNHYETRQYDLTDHLRQPSAAQPPDRVMDQRVAYCAAVALGLVRDDKALYDPASCRPRRIAPLVERVYQGWRGVSMTAPQGASPFYVDRKRLGKRAWPCFTCTQAPDSADTMRRRRSQ